MIYNDNILNIINKLMNNNKGICLTDFSDNCLCTALSTASLMIDEKIIYKDNNENKFMLTDKFYEWSKSNHISNIDKFKEYYFDIERLFAF